MQQPWALTIGVEPDGTFTLGTTRPVNPLELKLTLLNLLGTIAMDEARGEPRPPALFVPDGSLLRA